MADPWANHAEAPLGRRVIEIHQRCIDRLSYLLFGFDQSFEVHPQFLIIAAFPLNERRAILRVFFQGCVKERFQALPEFRSHCRFMEIVPVFGPNSIHGIRRNSFPGRTA